jgi:hypothetical protein
MSIEQLENKLALAQAKLKFCERLAAWPRLSAKSVLKAEDWARGARLAALQCLSAVAHERLRLGARSLHTVSELRSSAEWLRQLGGEKVLRAAVLAEVAARARKSGLSATASNESPPIVPSDEPPLMF